MKRKRGLYILFTLMICSVLAFAADGVRIEEWRIPPADIFPHDPAVAPDARPWRIAVTADDMVWYSDYQRGYLGRLDPQRQGRGMAVARRPESPTLRHDRYSGRHGLV